MDITKTKRRISIYYWFIFFSYGAFFPLLSVYLKNGIQLTDIQAGTIMSLGPIVMLLTQPIWGLLCDYTSRPKRILFITLVATALMAVPYFFAREYIWLIIVAIGLAAFQSAIVPVSDSLTVSFTRKHKEDYGKIRLWGALGFAFATFIMGWLSDYFGLGIIFFGMCLSLLIGALYSRFLPEDSGGFAVDFRSGLKELIKYPKFILFIASAFLIFGPIQANNFYFGLLIVGLGGTAASVGIAFLFAAGLEAPFMRGAGKWVSKYGYLTVTIAAALISGLRWIFYIFEPDVIWIYISTIAQGFSVGLYIPAALNYVKKIAPDRVSVTAVSLYSASGTGLGNWFCLLLSGFLMQWYTISAVYLFYSILTFSGIALLAVIVGMEKKEKITESVVA